MRKTQAVVKATVMADGREKKLHRFSIGRYLCTHSSEHLVQMGETFNFKRVFTHLHQERGSLHQNAQLRARALNELGSTHGLFLNTHVVFSDPRSVSPSFPAILVLVFLPINSQIRRSSGLSLQASKGRLRFTDYSKTLPSLTPGAPIL